MTEQEALFEPSPIKEKARKPNPVSRPEPIKRLYISDGLMFGLIDGGQEETFTAPVTWGRMPIVKRVEPEGGKD